MDNHVTTKPSWKTGEFWVGAVLPQVPAILGVILGASNPITIAIGAVAAIAYAFARTGHKTDVALAVIEAAGAAAAKANKGE